MGEGAGEVTDQSNLPDDERGDDPDAETAQKVMELDQTREEMHETVEAIGDRLSPAAITQSAKETVREATVGKVEDMAQSATRVLDDAGMTALEARTGIVETIRQNPIPTAMAGIGLAWLLTHRAPGYQTTRWPDSRRQRSWDNPQGDSMRRRVDAVGDRASDIGDRVTGRVEEGVDALGRSFDDVGQRVGDVPDQVTYKVHDLSEQARSLIEDSPLAVGAVAVAVGTAIGAALPSTSTERRVLRPAANQAIEVAEQKATDALDQAEQRMSASTSSQTKSGTSRARSVSTSSPTSATSRKPSSGGSAISSSRSSGASAGGGS
jgi:gas vesicle protein